MNENPYEGFDRSLENSMRSSQTVSVRPKPQWRRSVISLGEVHMIFVVFLAATAILVAVFPTAIWSLIAVCIALWIRGQWIEHRRWNDSLEAPKFWAKMDQMSKDLGTIKSDALRIQGQLCNTEAERDSLQGELIQLRQLVVQLKSRLSIQESLRIMLTTFAKVCSENNTAIKQAIEIDRLQNAAISELQDMIQDIREGSMDTHVQQSLPNHFNQVVETVKKSMPECMLRIASPQTPSSPFPNPMISPSAIKEVFCEAVGVNCDCEAEEPTSDTQVYEDPEDFQETEDLPEVG